MYKEYNSIGGIMDKYKKEIITTDLQLILSFISLITVIVSIIILYNDRLKIDNKEFISNKNEYYTILLNRFIILIIFTSFLILNYNDYIDAKKSKKKNIEAYYLQVISSILIVTSAIITLYVSYNDRKNLNVDIENPVI